MSGENTGSYDNSPRHSKYGWSWIGELSVKEPTPGCRLRYEITPVRPKTTDVGNPIVWVRGCVTDMRAARPGNRAVREANKIIRNAGPSEIDALFEQYAAVEEALSGVEEQFWSERAQSEGGEV